MFTNLGFSGLGSAAALAGAGIANAGTALGQLGPVEGAAALVAAVIGIGGVALVSHLTRPKRVTSRAADLPDDLREAA